VQRPHRSGEKNKNRRVLLRRLPIVGEQPSFAEVVITRLAPIFRPSAGSGERARSRTFSRFHDLYLDPPLRALIAQANPAARDPKVVGERLAELTARLDQLENLLADEGFAAGPSFTFADCALAPTTFIANNVLPFFGSKPAVEGRPRLSRWWSHVQTRPSVKRALAEMAEALAQQMQRG